MKKIILGLCLLSFAMLGLQNEVYAHNSDMNRYKKSHHSSGYKRAKFHNVRYYMPKYHKQSHLVYRSYNPCYIEPIRHVDYYSPAYLGFGYSNYNSGYHIQVGFD